MATYINNQSKYIHRLLLFPIYSLLVFRFLLVPGFHSLHCSVVVCAEAKEVRQRLVLKDLPPPYVASRIWHIVWPWDRPKLWVLRKDAPGYAPYKNDRLTEYQLLLIDRGIKDTDSLRLLAAQLFQENGALSETVVGDHGCSLGIIQYNVCAHHGMKVAPWLKKPENQVWKDYKFQLSVMADSVAARFKKFDGNIKLVIVAHNSPAAAARGTDTKAGYYKSITKKTSLFTTL